MKHKKSASQQKSKPIAVKRTHKLEEAPRRVASEEKPLGKKGGLYSIEASALASARAHSKPVLKAALSNSTNGESKARSASAKKDHVLKSFQAHEEGAERPHMNREIK